MKVVSNRRVRAVAMVRAHQQNTEHAVDRHIFEVDRDACRGLRAGYVTMAAELKKTCGGREVVVVEAVSLEAHQ